MLGNKLRDAIMAARSKNRELCKNCYNPSGIRRRGYCGRCYDLVKRIEAAKKWNRLRPTTLERLPNIYDPDSKQFFLNTFSNDEFEIFRDEYVRQAQSRLKQLSLRGERRQGKIPVNPFDIERQLVGILRLLRPKEKYTRDARFIELHFDQEQRRLLYDLLAEIEEAIPWTGFDSRKAFDLIRQYRAKLSKEIVAER